MLKLTEIVKDYRAGDNIVRALDGISVEFRKSEFVSVLGASGCGKTTLLNIIGGLDRYTSGQLNIEGQNTDTFKSVDWDLYRNQRIGFIFQSYNLIPQISILANVELALTLSGVPAKERKARAAKALEEVGLGAQLKKKPNQLSGGQMQRVSIARALINNPDIILADEPTGALDSTTSVNVMELLKEIAKDKLVIMVTHNPELAEKYSTRIIRMSDGKITGDSMPYDSSAEDEARVQAEKDSVITVAEGEDAAKTAESEPQKDAFEEGTRKAVRELRKQKKARLKKTSMSFSTAVALSFQNIKSKMGRNMMTVGAGSIGIICVCLVLGLSTGLTAYINSMGEEMLAANPVMIGSITADITPLLTGETNFQELFGENTYPENDVISGETNSIVDQMQTMVKTNTIDEDFIAKIKKDIEPIATAVSYDYGYDAMLLSKVSVEYEGSDLDLGGITGGLTGEAPQDGNPFSQVGGIGNVSSALPLQQLAGEEYFDLLAGHLPENANEVVLVVSGSNTVSEAIMAAFDLYGEKVSAAEFVGRQIKIVYNDEKYEKVEGGKFSLRTDYDVLWNTSSSEIEMLTVCGVIRPQKLNDAGTALASMSAGLAYGDGFMERVYQHEHDSEVVIAQQNDRTHDVTVTGEDDTLYTGILTYMIAMAGNVTNIYDPVIFSVLTDFMTGVYPLYDTKIATLGASKLPISIDVYAMNYGVKEAVLAAADANKIQYTDMAGMITGMLSNMVDVISVVLICFTSVSLVVSSVMIGIITYISVVERTKEIGILRSLGARKTDVARVFIAESLMIGLASGILGALLAYLLSVPINAIVGAVLGDMIAGASLCILQPYQALLMVGVSAVLTVIAGSIPSYIASKRDPVIAEKRIRISERRKGKGSSRYKRELPFRLSLP